QDILAELQEPFPRGEELACVRALEVLERIGTPTAERLLKELAEGDPEALQTKHARAACERLRKAKRLPQWPRRPAVPAGRPLTSSARPRPGRPPSPVLAVRRCGDQRRGLAPQELEFQPLIPSQCLFPIRNRDRFIGALQPRACLLRLTESLMRHGQ